MELKQPIKITEISTNITAEAIKSNEELIKSKIMSLDEIDSQIEQVRQTIEDQKPEEQRIQEKLNMQKVFYEHIEFVRASKLQELAELQEKIGVKEIEEISK